MFLSELGFVLIIGKYRNNLTDLTYDIVQESCDNYGDYSKSKYQDIVSEQIYKNMNYLYVENCTDKKQFRKFLSQKFNEY